MEEKRLNSCWCFLDICFPGSHSISAATSDGTAEPQPQLLELCRCSREEKLPPWLWGTAPEKGWAGSKKEDVTQEPKLHPSSRQDTPVPHPCCLSGPSSFSSPQHHWGKYLSSTAESGPKCIRFTSVSGSAHSVPQLLPVTQLDSP